MSALLIHTMTAVMARRHGHGVSATAMELPAGPACLRDQARADRRHRAQPADSRRRRWRPASGADSLGLLSDAVHNFTDMAALGITWFAIEQAKKPPTAEKTFGYHRTGILTALINSLAMVAVTLWIFYEAYQRFLDPQPVGGALVMITATLALCANLGIVGSPAETGLAAT